MRVGSGLRALATRRLQISRNGKRVNWGRSQNCSVAETGDGVGGVTFVASLSGTPNALLVRSQASIEDFRRYDVMSNRSLRLSTACTGKYSAQDSALTDLSCESPVGGGVIRLKGNAVGSANMPRYDLTFVAEKVPISSFLQVLRHAKKGLPRPTWLRAGIWTLSFAGVERNRGFGQAIRPGQGVATDVRLVSGSEKDEVIFGSVPLTVSNANQGVWRRSRARPLCFKSHCGGRGALTDWAVPTGDGRDESGECSGWLSASGYRFHVGRYGSEKRLPSREHDWVTGISSGR